MKQRILIMGLPGSGKTYLADALKKYLEQHGTRADYGEMLPITGFAATVTWFNADDVRRKYNDWDFSKEGRIRQSLRMLEFALASNTDYVICDFVAPIPEMRNNFKAAWTIWMDTIEQGRFEDTNKMFVPPEVYDFRITEKNAEKWAEFVGSHIIDDRRRPTFNWQKESALLLGRYQPWHAGHRALFERAIVKSGQVIIQVRDCQGWNDSNPFEFEKVKSFIKRDLDPIYQGQYEIMLVPNITEIVYGRDVGYKITQETFTDEIHAISATKIRKAMGLK
jgi:hypothetical protein